jgi:hypothetical protein
MRTLAGALVVVAGAILFVGHELAYAEVLVGSVGNSPSIRDFPGNLGFAFAYVLVVVGIVFMIVGLVRDGRGPD